MISFSIIIPVYNSEQFLRRCLESIINQTYNHFDVYIVDDGSTDNSWTICNEYSVKYQRIHIFHQDNKGAASARNFALQKVNGDYILLVDSDDSLELDCLESLAKLAISNDFPDIIEFKLKYHACDGSTNLQGTILSDGFYDRSFISERFIPAMIHSINDDSICYSIFNVLRVFKRTLQRSYSIWFDAEIRRWEDWLFAIELFYAANSMVVTNQPLYNYFGHEQGGLGGRYDPNTIYYVFKTLITIDSLDKGKYNTFSNDCIAYKISLIDRCICEIFENESKKDFCTIVYPIVQNEYFAKIVNVCHTNERINIIKKYLNINKYNRITLLLWKYYKRNDIKNKLRRTFSKKYHFLVNQIRYLKRRKNNEY